MMFSEAYIMNADSGQNLENLGRQLGLGLN